MIRRVEPDGGPARGVDMAAFAFRSRFALALVATGLFAAACGGSSGGGKNAQVASQTTPSSTASSAAAGAAVTIATHKGPLGTYLTTSTGMSLYMFAADSGGKSNCNSSCVQYWPPLAGSSAQTTGAANSAMTGTIMRSDGTSQITYAGHPLYTYVGDTKAGDTNGQGKDLNGGKWYLLDPKGAQISGSASGNSGTSSGWS